MFTSLINKLTRLYRSIPGTEVLRLELSLNYEDGETHLVRTLRIHTKDAKVLERKIGVYMNKNVVPQTEEGATYEILLKVPFWRSPAILDLVHRHVAYSIRRMYQTEYVAAINADSTIHPIIHVATTTRVRFALKRMVFPRSKSAVH